MPSLRPLEVWLGNWRQPDFWLRLLCTAVVVIALTQVLQFAHGRDQSIYATVAQGILEGEMPYLDRWDFKPPGIFLIYACAEALFQDAMWGIRVLEGLGLVLLFIALVRLSSKFFADDRPGYLGGAIATLIHTQLEFWHTAQPETFGGYFTVLGIWLCAAQPKRKRWEYAAWLACGVTFGAAFLLKPPLGGGVVVCAMYVLVNRFGAPSGRLATLLPAAVMVIGAFLPILATVVWFVARGAWPALSWTLFDFTPGYTKLGWTDNAAGAYYKAVEHLFTGHSALIAVGAVAAAVGAPTATREREGLALLLGVVSIHLAGIAMQAKYFAYHFDATLMLIGLVSGLGWFKIWRKAMARGQGGAVAFASLLVLTAVARVPVTDVPHGFWERVLLRTKFMFGSGHVSRPELDRDLYRAADFDLGADRDLAGRVRELSGANDRIYVWGFEPLVYWLSGRAPASRFIYNVPQRAPWGREQARSLLMGDLGEQLPRVFIVQHDDYFKFVTGNDDDSYGSLRDFPELSQLLAEHYRHVERVQDFELYTLRAQ
jgi:hypothetical protein